jgi:hypothetical protein
MVEVRPLFGGTYWVHVQGRRVSQAGGSRVTAQATPVLAPTGSFCVCTWSSFPLVLLAACFSLVGYLAQNWDSSFLQNVCTLVCYLAQNWDSLFLQNICSLVGYLAQNRGSSLLQNVCTLVCYVAQNWGSSFFQKSVNFCQNILCPSRINKNMLTRDNCNHVRSNYTAS